MYPIALDLVAISVLVFGVYFPRHHRRDLVTAYIGVNIGVLAVSTVLSSSTVSFGIGMGLFGVLSIIRLRSLEIDQQEVAYYFASLAVALVSGLESEPSFPLFGIVVLLVVGMYVADHPRIFPNHRQQVVTVDRAIVDEEALREHLETLLGVEVLDVHTLKLDLVNDSTQVDVRFRIART